MDDRPRHRFLNGDGRWPSFEWVGLELQPDGALALEPLPRVLGPPVAPLAHPPDGGQAGIAVAAGGDVYMSDPEGHRIRRFAACDPASPADLCRHGRGPGQLRRPRGLAVHGPRGVLLVADSGNHRIQWLALPSLELAQVTAGLADPRALACDTAGNVYVVEAGRSRVTKLDPRGTAVPGFWDASEGAEPIDVAVDESGAGTRVLVLDAASARVLVVDGDGVPQQPPLELGAIAAAGLAAAGGAVYVGDADTDRLLAFRLSGGMIGDAVGFSGPVAAMTFDGPDALLVHRGGTLPPVRLAVRGGFAGRGVMWGGPFRDELVDADARHLVRAGVERFGSAHAALHVALMPAGAEPPVRPDAPDPFADPAWTRVPGGGVETLVPATPDETLWCGMTFSGEGDASPVLRQIRVDFGHIGYLAHLPPLYQKDAAARDLLARWLAVFESAFDSTRAGIEELPRLFDPAAAPDAWLPWLAGWLAHSLPADWDEERRRQAIADAFAADERRGTAAGLRAQLADVGLRAIIEEPLRQSGWWALAPDLASPAQAALSVLGAGTVLAVGEPQGAVAGTTAVLDGSFLMPQAQYARPLFTDVAHQFTVRVYRGAHFSEPRIAAARAVLERERPAHTTYHLCVVEPRMRVGVQARVGIDAIVGGPPAAGRLGGGDLVLGGGAGGRTLGRDSRVGGVHLGGEARTHDHGGSGRRRHDAAT
jgi:phage tail-like protein